MVGLVGPRAPQDLASYVLRNDQINCHEMPAGLDDRDKRIAELEAALRVSEAAREAAEAKVREVVVHSEYLADENQRLCTLNTGLKEQVHSLVNPPPKRAALADSPYSLRQRRGPKIRPA